MTDRATDSESASHGGVREVAALAAPIVLTQVLVTAMGVADSMIVGRLGAAPLGAVGLGGMWAWTLSSFFVGLSTAVQTFVAQTHGAGRDRECGSWCWQGLWAALPLAAALSGALFLGAEAFVERLAPSEELAPLATGYMRARSLGIVGLTAAVSFSSFFRGIGDVRTPLYATLVANAVNIGLDLGLVYGWFGFPQLGVVGAGIATAISEWIYCAVILIAFLRKPIRIGFETRFVPPSLDATRRLLRTGLPIGGQWITEMLSFAVFTTGIARMGDAALAASHAYIQLLSLSFMQAEGISMAAATLVGRYLGAGEPERVKRSFRSSILLGSGLSLAIAALYLAIPETLLGLFTTDPAVLAYGAPLLAIGAAYQYCDCMAIITDGALRGAGDTRWPFVARSTMSWVFFLPLAWLLAYPAGGGIFGAWLGGLASMVVLAILLVFRFRSGAWRRIRI